MFGLIQHPAISANGVGERESQKGTNIFVLCQAAQGPSAIDATADTADSTEFLYTTFQVHSCIRRYASRMQLGCAT